MEGYFLITSGESGIRIKGPLDEAALRKLIEPDKHGDYYFGRPLDFQRKVPECDRGYFTDAGDRPAILIKGEIVVPKAKTVATVYEL